MRFNTKKLIADSVTQTAELYRQLGVVLGDRDVIKAVESAFAESTESQKHRTSNDTASSLHRWQQEADDSSRKLFAIYCQELEEIGYS